MKGGLLSILHLHIIGAVICYSLIYFGFMYIVSLVMGEKVNTYRTLRGWFIYLVGGTALQG